MAVHTTFAQRLLIAGGFAVAASAGPVIAALATPAGPADPALAQCPPGQVLNVNSGACEPVTDSGAAPTTTNPIEPGITDLQPGSLTESSAGNLGQLPEINGIPCEGGNTGLCLGLNQNNPSNTGGVTLPPVPVGVQP